MLRSIYWYKHILVLCIEFNTQHQFWISKLICFASFLQYAEKDIDAAIVTIDTNRKYKLNTGRIEPRYM